MQKNTTAYILPRCRRVAVVACGVVAFLHPFSAPAESAVSAPPEGEATALAPPPLEPSKSVVDPFEAALLRARYLQRPSGMEWVRVPTLKDARPSTSFFSQTAEQQSHSEAMTDRLRAVEACGLLDPSSALDRLVPMFDDGDEEVRDAAAAQAVQTDLAALLERLLTSMTADPLSTERMDLLPAFEPYLSDGVLDIFTATDLPPSRRMAAARLLGFMGARCATESLAREAQSADVEWATVCAQSLDQLGDPAAVKPWIALLPHPVFEIGAMAVEALATSGGRLAFEAIKGVVLSPAPPSEKLRARAVQALGHWPAADAGPVLVVLMESNPGFVDVAYQSLRALTGRDFGAQTKAWRDWFEAGMPAEQKEQAPAESPTP